MSKTKNNLFEKDKVPFDTGLLTSHYLALLDGVSSPKQLAICQITHSYANKFVENHHYLKRKIYIARNVSYGLMLDTYCVGVAMFGYPVWREYPNLVPPLQIDECPELIRLATLGGLPRNTESYFLSRCLKGIVEDWEAETEYSPKCVTSFCDVAYGFDGAIYKATNFDLFRYTDGRPTNPGGAHGKWGANDYTQLPKKALYVYWLDKRAKKQVQALMGRT